MGTLEDVINCETVSRVPLKLAQPLFCLVCQKKRGGLTKFRKTPCISKSTAFWDRKRRTQKR
jgi:hypothetical protein